MKLQNRQLQRDLSVLASPQGKYERYEIPPTRDRIEPVKQLFAFNAFQLGIVWSALAGSLVFVFLLGFHSGREQGLEVALEGYQEGMSVKFPVARAQIESRSLGVVESIGQGSEGVITEQTAVESAENPVYDFSADASRLAAKAVEQVEASVAPPKAKHTAAPEMSEKLAAGWYVQLAATESYKKARNILEELTSAGFPGRIQKATVEAKRQEKEYFRVLSGPFPGRSKAESVRSEIKDLSIAKGKPFVKRVR